MQPIMLRDRADVRRFTRLWGALTGVYLATVLYRLFALHHTPGLPTYAGLSAIAAVWLSLFDAGSPHDVFRLGAITSLFASVTLNLAVITRAVVAGRTIPVTRSLFTILLMICLFRMTWQELRQVNHKEKG